MGSALFWLIGTLLLVSVLVALSAQTRRPTTHNDEYPNDKEQYGYPKQIHVASAQDVDSSSHELPKTITRSVEDHMDRGAWVLRLSHHVFAERNQSQHNVVVINKELEYHFNVRGVVERFVVDFYQHKSPSKVSYEVVVFKEGTLINRGDGGDINWDWMGNFVRNGTGMIVFKPCKTGVVYKQDPWLAF